MTVSPTKLKEVEQSMRALDDNALQRLVAIEASNYTPEALKIARDELKRRNLDSLNDEEYLKQFPSERVGDDGFCGNCRAQTTSDSPGSTTVVNFVFGIRLIGCDDRCSACGSVIQT